MWWTMWPCSIRHHVVLGLMCLRSPLFLSFFFIFIHLPGLSLFFSLLLSCLYNGNPSPHQFGLQVSTCSFSLFPPDPDIFFSPSSHIFFPLCFLKSPPFCLSFLFEAASHHLVLTYWMLCLFSYPCWCTFSLFHPLILCFRVKSCQQKSVQF